MNKIYPVSDDNNSAAQRRLMAACRSATLEELPDVLRAYGLASCATYTHNWTTEDFRSHVTEVEYIAEKVSRAKSLARAHQILTEERWAYFILSEEDEEIARAEVEKDNEEEEVDYGDPYDDYCDYEDDYRSFGPDYLDNEPAFANPGGNSALRAATPSNPRNLPCPNCKTPNVLTPADRRRGYQCDRCADRAERGYDY